MFFKNYLIINLNKLNKLSAIFDLKFEVFQANFPEIIALSKIQSSLSSIYSFSFSFSFSLSLALWNLEMQMIDLSFKLDGYHSSNEYIFHVIIICFFVYCLLLFFFLFISNFIHFKHRIYSFYFK